MTSNITPQKFRKYLTLLLLACIGLFSATGFAQNKQYANSETHGINSAALLLGGNVGGYNSTNNTSIANVTNSSSAVDGDETTAATLKANLVNILLLGATGESWMQFKFQNGVAANKTTFIKVSDPQISGATLDLLGTVGGLLGLLQKEFIFTEVYNNGVQLNSADVVTSVARDAQGNLYLAITPSNNYTDVRVKLRFQGQLLGLSFGAGVEMDIYEAFHYTSSDNCGSALVTSFQTTGVDLSLLDFGNANLKNAIDTDVNTYSIIKSTSVLNVSAGASFSQFFNFPGQSPNSSSLNIKLALGSGGLVNADLLGAIEVVLYDGTRVVYNRSLQGSLLNNTNLLSLLDSGQPITLTFVPGREFDRAEIRLNSSVGVGLLGNGLKIYDVQRYNSADGCVNPNVRPLAVASQDPFDTPSCSSALIDFDNTDYAQRAADGNNESYATVYADAGSLLVSGPITGYVTLDMGAHNANQTTYVRINYDDQVLDKLLGGSLGKAVADLAGNLLLGNQYIQVEVFNGTSTTPILDKNSSTAFEGTAGGTVTVVQDKIGRYYLAIRPDAVYDKIKISNHVTAVLATGTKSSLDVYGACFEIGTDPCFPANFTAYYGNGLNLSLADISNVGVTNPDRAIDGSSSSYSKINLGVAGVVASVYQSIYFNRLSQTGDKVAIRLMVEPSSTLSLSLLGAYEIKFYKGSQLVNSYDLEDAALINNIDLLALFNSGGVVELTYTPDGTFDRVDIGAESTVALTVAVEPLRVYSVERYGTTCPRTITASPFDSPSCSTRLVDAQNADDVQNLFDADFDSYATLKSGAGTLLGLGGKYEGYVEMGYPTTMAAGTTSYIRIDFEPNILAALLNGSLGNISTDLLGSLVLGDHYFQVDVKNNVYDASGNVTSSTLIESANSKDAATGGVSHIRIVQDKLGRYYIAVTPDQAYNAIRVTDFTDSTLGLLTSPNTMNVYGMCTELSTDPCLDAFATSSEYAGVNLGASGLGTAGVKNAANAIDNNTSNYSEINIGAVGVLANAKQWIYFNTLSEADDVVMIDFKTEGGVVDLNVLGGIEIIAYKGDTQVAILDWQNGIVNGVNVLSLIANNQHVQVPFKPNVQFDRISVGLSTALVSASVLPTIHLYQVDRCYSLGSPKIVTWKSFEINNDPSLTDVKGGETVEYTIHVENTGSVDIAGIQIEDAIPAHTAYVSGGTNTSGVISFDNINVLVGQTVTRSFIVKVDENLTGVDFIENTALVKLNPSDPGTETFPPLPGNPAQPDPSGPTGTDIPVYKISSVVMWKAYDVNGDNTITTVSGGETVNYHIYVRNTGNQDLTNLEISDVLPAGMTYVSGGAFDSTTGAVTFTIPNLTVGATTTPLTFTVIVNQDLTGITELKNIATAQPDPSEPVTESYPPTDNTNPTDPDTSLPPGTVIDVTPIHDIEVVKNGVANTATPGQVQVGDQVTYTIIVKNTGNKTLTNVLVEDVLSNVYDTPTASVGTFISNSYSYTIPTIAVGATETITITANVNNINPANLDANGDISNTVDITYQNSDNTGNITESATHKLPTLCIVITNADIGLPADFSACINQSITLDASYAGVGTLTNPVYKWYKKADLSDIPYVGPSLTTTLSVTTTYYVTLEASGHCVNTTPAEVTVTINDPGTPTGPTTQKFCETESKTVADLTVTGTNVIWYDAATGGNVIIPTTVLTDGIYYASSVGASGCESTTRLAVTVIINDPGTPTTSDQTQDFCAIDNTTVADIQVNETNVTWYDAATGGNVVPAATALVNGTIYYASLTGTNGCESATRLDVTVSITDPGTATTTDQTQDFCAIDNSTVADIQVNETNVTWYDAATGGNVITPTTALTNGTIYYASLTGANGCESATRLDVTVSITDPGTPTTSDQTQDFCAVDNPTVANIIVRETNVTWYDAATGGNVVPAVTALTNGMTYYASLTGANGCESATRLDVTVSITDPGTPTTSDQTQDFCAIDNSTVADIQVNETNVTWYDAATGGNVVPAVTALTNGMTYYASLTGASGCESATRLDVTVTINDPGTPTGNPTQSFCVVDNPTVANIIVGETNVTWYDAATGGNVITPTTALTNGMTYYASLTGASGCESATRLDVMVTINDPGTPTTSDQTQDFCAVNNSTVADIQVNETNVTWYDAATGGNVITPTTALTNGMTYYASLTGANGCESATRLDVTVTINDPGTPTTSDQTQDFCAVNNSTVADIQVNETNVTWYDAATGGNVITPTTALTNGMTYYASLTGASGCESATRLDVTVTINDPGTPTTSDQTQDFCAVNNSTVADIQVNETNVTWYDAATGGNIITPTTALTNGMTYYASLTGANGCESATRLAISVSMSQNPDASITGPTTDVCSYTEVTYTTVSGMTNYIWTVTGGDITAGGATTDAYVRVSWTDLSGNTAVEVAYTDPSGCTANPMASLPVTVVTCGDMVISSTVSKPKPMIGEEVLINITIKNNGNGIFNNVVVKESLPSGYIFNRFTLPVQKPSAAVGSYNPSTGVWNIPKIEAKDELTLGIFCRVISPGDYLNVAEIVSSKPLDANLSNNRTEVSVAPICLTIYNEFSPNNDGSNDTFRIDCIETYPNSVLKIYDRYGNLVFQKKGYQNDWRGTSVESSFSDKLPADTYFYVLELKSENTVKKGWLYLIR